MELPITDKELATIVSALRLGGDTSLYQKLKKIHLVIKRTNFFKILSKKLKKIYQIKSISKLIRVVKLQAKIYLVA